MNKKEKSVMNSWYIDLGSSTIKTYRFGDKLELVEEYSIYFKNGFSEEFGISEENKKALYEYFKSIKDKYCLQYENTNIYATGIFRNLNADQRNELVKYFNDMFDLHFNVISHGIENYYLGKAMEADYNGNKVMIINMGGKTTEIVTIVNNEITERHNLKIGVADLLNAFPTVNDTYASVKTEELVDFVKEKIADVNFDTDYDCAIFTGGELRFEKLTEYNLVPNTLFSDNIHEYMLSFEDFVEGNKNVFYNISLQELYNLMPGNPKWMDGARPGAVLPQAIFEKAKITKIIPSDLNLIDGVIKDLQNN